MLRLQRREKNKERVNTNTIGLNEFAQIVQRESKQYI